jgi:hypothetical protein
MPESEVALAVASYRIDRSGSAARSHCGGLRRRITSGFVGVMLIGAWVLMSLPAILVSRLNSPF